MTKLLLVMAGALLLASGVALAATINGDDKNNVLYGTDQTDQMDGKGGADALLGRKGDDFLKGGAGNDNFQTTLTGRKGTITAGLRGGAGNDTLDGQAGNDDLMGHGGNDILSDISPLSTSEVSDWDRAFAGPGDDTIDVADGDYRDEVVCGDGFDKVKIDVGEDSSGVPQADTVYEVDQSGKSIPCEVIEEKQSGETITVAELPQPAGAQAPKEPAAEEQ